MARKVVGVGSVGTRAWVVLLMGRDGQDPLFLQAKEAEASVLEPYAGASEFDNHGQRVVEGQWLMQAASDIFLGWLPGARARRPPARLLRAPALGREALGRRRDACRREGLAIYGRVCGWTLARAHARSGDRIAIGAYLGKRREPSTRRSPSSPSVYADQNERDYAALLEAIDSGRVEAEDA